MRTHMWPIHQQQMEPPACLQVHFLKRRVDASITYENMHHEVTCARVRVR